MAYVPSLTNEGCTHFTTLSDCDWTVAGQVTWSTLVRPMWGVWVCWVITACATGYGGMLAIFTRTGFRATLYGRVSMRQYVTSTWYYLTFITLSGVVNTFLSWSFFTPLSRLTYLGYLIHVTLIVVFFGHTTVQFYATTYFMVGLHVDF